MLKNPRTKWLLAGGAVLLLAFGFFWLAVRPVLVRKDCSWVTYTTPATEAFAGITQTQADENKKTCLDTNSHIISGIKPFCYDTEVQPPRPAEPARQVTRNATLSEYQTCLRHHGL